ncbi:hypothetical protein DFH08DRAFT_1055026 [Mycena albidolilacea]|uniref:Uncharacterized protein n=1 Tax=Mycena albidolilacea TaxID=1033008 RepID=A0AAD6Z3J0_9AGAR|nr:hypothetical protein DFH08DRAFT_1055026 [Mycena albidolilacea]
MDRAAIKAQTTEERHAIPREKVDRTSQSQNWDTGGMMTKVPGLAPVPYTVTAINLRTVTVWIPSFTWISTSRISPSKYGRGLALQNRARHGAVTVRYGAVFRGPRLRCPALDKTGEFVAGVFRISLGDSVANRDPLMIRVKMVRRYEPKRTLDGPGFNVQRGHREIEDLITKTNKYTKYTPLWLWENGFLGWRRTAFNFQVGCSGILGNRMHGHLALRAPTDAISGHAGSTLTRQDRAREEGRLSEHEQPGLDFWVLYCWVQWDSSELNQMHARRLALRTPTNAVAEYAGSTLTRQGRAREEGRLSEHEQPELDLCTVGIEDQTTSEARWLQGAAVAQSVQH